MNNPRPLPDVDYLRRIFDYDPESGVLRWRENPDRPASWNTRYSGQTAGSLDSKGYLRASIKKVRYAVHRIAFALFNGRDSEYEIDHRDGDKTNNRGSNLREASHKQNMRNRIPSSGRSLPKGVTLHGRRKKYQAVIHVDGMAHYLGLFVTVEDAKAAYAAAAHRYFGEFARVE